MPRSDAVPILEIFDVNLVYGELAPHVLPHIINHVLSVDTLPCNDATLQGCTDDDSCFPLAGRVLVDLGSGEGIPVLATSLYCSHIFSTCVGLELLPHLHATALRHAGAVTSHSPCAVHFALGDITRVHSAAGRAHVSDWPAYAACVFINATCFDDATLTALYRHAAKLRRGAVLAITTHALPVATGVAKLFNVLWQGRVHASWGSVVLRVYVRNDTPKWVATVLR